MPAFRLPSRHEIAVVVVPALLVVVALVQIGRAATLDQSSYAGFGFGMFATYENELSRWTEVTGTDSDGRVVSVRPPADPDLRAQEVPTKGNVESLAASVLAADPSLVSVRAAVWTVAASGRPMRLERILLEEARMERTP